MERRHPRAEQRVGAESAGEVTGSGPVLPGRRHRPVALAGFLVAWAVAAGCGDSASGPVDPSPPMDDPTVPERPATVKALAISPEGFPTDFSRLPEFFEEASALPDPGVMWNGPWREDALDGTDAGTPPGAAILTAVQGESLGFDPVLVFGWRAADQPLIRIPSNPANDWSNQEAAELYVAVVEEVAEAHSPPFLFLGNESDFYYTVDPEDYERWVQVYNTAYDRIKAVSQETRVGPIFQYERMAGIGSLAGLTTPRWEALLAHDPDRVDVVGITLYPFLAHETPEAVPEGYLGPLVSRIGDAPIAVTETGWPGDVPEGFEPPWEVSEEHQVTYLETLTRILDGRDVPLLTWVFLYPPVQPAGEGFDLLDWQIFHSISLRNLSGAQRPVYSAWRDLQIP